MTTLSMRLMGNSGSNLVRPTLVWLALASLGVTIGCHGPSFARFRRQDCPPTGASTVQETPENNNFSNLDYPRFHPVPTQPVFTPRGHFAPLGPGNELAKPKADQPNGSSIELKILPPQPSPVAPLPPESADASNPIPPAIPNRLNPTSPDHSGWVFRPGIPESALKNMDPSVVLKHDPGAKTDTAKSR